ncbi:MAG: hypothetical protein R3A13_02645 [Bdellovibrionota bacterium]
MSSSKGNNPELWEKLLNTLDERLQLGLLDHLRRVSSYHFEDKLLIIEPLNSNDHEYLTRKAVQQQLETFAKDITKVERLEIKASYAKD